MDKPTTIINNNTTTINNYGNANANDVDNSVNVNPDLDQIADTVKQLEEVKHNYTKLAVALIGMITVLISSILNPAFIKIIMEYLGL
jgi:hypothetical protein